MRRLLIAAAWMLLVSQALAQNFICSDAEIQQAAEQYRKDLAIQWLGKELPQWAKPCPIYVTYTTGNGGSTSFIFQNGEVFGWRMNVQGSRQRILDSVLPHEVLHTIFATHFRQPLPRWLDEGAASTSEHETERTKYNNMLIEHLKTGRGIPFSVMFATREYPRDILPLYSQGHSVVSFLLAHGPRCHFVKYVETGLKSSWTEATKEHYRYESLSDLQLKWLDWVKAGRPLPHAASQVGGSCVPQACAQEYMWDGCRWVPLHRQPKWRPVNPPPLVPVNPPKIPPEKPSDPSSEQKQPSTNVEHSHADILAQIKSNTEQIQQILVLVKQNQTSVTNLSATVTQELKTVTDAQSNLREQVQGLDVTSQLQAIVQSQTQIVDGLKTSGGSTELDAQIRANASAIAEMRIGIENNATAISQLQVQIETGNQDLVTKIEKLETLNQKLLLQISTLSKKSPCSDASAGTAKELSELFHILGGK
jgi:hypothetical protein